MSEVEAFNHESEDGAALSRASQRYVLASPEVVSFLHNRVLDIRANPQPVITREQFYAEFPD